MELGDTKIELLPPDLYKTEALLTVNGTQYVATEKTNVVLPLMVHDKLLIAVYPTSGLRKPPVIQLTTAIPTIKVIFDGFSVYLWVSCRYGATFFLRWVIASATW